MSKKKQKCWSLMWMSKAKENLRFNVDVKQKTKCWSLMWMSKAKENLRFNVDVKKKNKSAGV
jgi:hypothetical protein